ncbi:DNA polymerase I [Synechocystis salina]|uniref:DNA polymerase I n=1 Tax=Synechocystis salina LEGE 00031 TaxID=1828736 RepID=A0ABR9VST7_9SYNC|nr:DNA polymerase I [Synechocystis salina LEGE 00041]MBE9254427.1 DNA polymerase I [Synechocystis salina LEGE 00031]
MLMSAESPLLLLVDGHSLAFRAYYAFGLSKKGPLRTTAGIPTSVCFGFLNSLMQVMESQKPAAIAIAFDRREPTFRHEADVAYKSNRQETPEDFAEDLSYLQQLLQALNLQTITYAGYEADDILGTLAHKGSDAGYRVKILSGDRDLFQLVTPEQNISVLYLTRNPFASNTGYDELDWQGVVNKMGVTPAQIVDFKALCGDKSDCIPGINGIGEKTAIKLLAEYETLEKVYENLEQIKGALKTKLTNGKNDAIHSQMLARIVVDMPLEIGWEDLQLTGFSTDRLVPLLEKLELRTFIDKIATFHRAFGDKYGPVPVDNEVDNSPKDNAAKTNQNTKAKAKISQDDSQQLSLFDGVPTVIQEDGLITIQLPEQIQPQIITTIPQLQALVEELKNYTDAKFPVAWDTETNSLDPLMANLVGIGCAWGPEPHQVAYIPLGHHQGEQLSLDIVKDLLEEVLGNATYPKVLQNAKFDRRVLTHHGMELGGVVLDTMLASYVLQPEETHNLTDLCRRYNLGLVALSYKDLGLKKDQTIADLPLETAGQYCGLDCYATYLLAEKLQQELDDYPELATIVRDIEQPLEKILAAMEDRGIRIDCDYLQTLSEQLADNLLTIETTAYEAAGESFNLSSPKQLGSILFDKLGLDRKKSRKTKTGYSTDHATLEKLQGDHPIIDAILEHRTLAKLKSTYVDALPELVNPHTKRIHTDFNQAITSTGRLSSSNPNLQNIPIRSDFSRQIRRAFLPQENWLLVSADYSQIELRILAHLSQEPVLLQAYGDRQDVHAVTAKLLFGKEDITPAERNLGKTINFGVIYGMGAQRFARETGISAVEGREFIDRYHRTYAQVFDYLETMKLEAIAKGYVTTIVGRRRYFNFVTDALRRLRGKTVTELDLAGIKMNYNDAQLLRSAANAPIQGSSADIIKIAMVKLADLLENYQTRMLLQVHDELIFEMPLEEWEELSPLIQHTMEQALTLSVPLVVEMHRGSNWMEAK